MSYQEAKRFLEERKSVMKDPNPERRVRYGLEQVFRNMQRLRFETSPIELLTAFVIEELPHVGPDMRRVSWRPLRDSLRKPGIALVECWVDWGRHDSGLRWGDFLGTLYCETVRPRQPIPEYEKQFPCPPRPWYLRRQH
jgi:hypothetical protein